MLPTGSADRLLTDRLVQLQKRRFPVTIVATDYCD
jgi:hypothetical protein